MGKKKKSEKDKIKSAKKRLHRVVEQVKEPLSLLETFKEEATANVGMLLGMMAGAAKNFRVENVKPQLKEVINSLGFAKRAELEELEARLDELESRLSELEGGKGVRDEED